MPFSNGFGRSDVPRVLASGEVLREQSAPRRAPQKSGGARKSVLSSFGQGAQGLASGILGAPVDIASMLTNPLLKMVGQNPGAPIGGTESIGGLLGADVQSLPFAVGSILPVSPADALAGVAPMVGRAQKMIFRAHEADDLGAINKGTHWSPDEDVALSYTDNPGFGGPNIRSAPIPDDAQILDIGDTDTDGFRVLARELGYDDPEDIAMEWHGNGWMYPWEESGEVKRRLEASGYDFIQYLDDFPDGATTLRALKDFRLAD